MSESKVCDPSGRRRRIAAVLVAITAGLAAVVVWLGGVLPGSTEPLFRGKAENEWIRNLKYNDEQQVKEWRAYGEEGIQVLIRGLERASRPRERAYRILHRKLPDFLTRWLPDPNPDSTQGTREILVSLLDGLGPAARSATPTIIRLARTDESEAVRQGAIGFFITGGDNHRVVQMSTKERARLLPALIRAVEEAGNSALNAAIVLQFYPERGEVVAPVLVKALKDSRPEMRLRAAESLNRVAPEIAKKSGATSMLVGLTRDPDEQLAAMAVAALGQPGSQPELAVPTLIGCLGSTNSHLATEAVWALERAQDGFATYSDRIVGALATAGQRTDSVGAYARHAERKWHRQPDREPGARGNRE